MTTTNYTSEEIHKIGQDEVRKINEEIQKLAQKNGMKPKEYKEHMKNDTSNYFKTEAEYLTFVRDWCKRADSKLPALFGKLPRCPYGVSSFLA